MLARGRWAAMHRFRQMVKPPGATAPTEVHRIGASFLNDPPCQRSPGSGVRRRQRVNYFDSTVPTPNGESAIPFTSFVCDDAP